MPEKPYYPVVIVPGIGQSKVVEIDGAGEPLRTVWPLDISKDLLLDRLKGPFMKMMLLRRDAGFTDALGEVAAEIMSGISAGPDGAPKKNLRAISYPYPFSECTDDEKRYICKMAPVQDLAAVIGEENIFFFTYHSFERPYTVADQLNAYVQMVQERTGSDKINFMPLSLGGAMFTAYLDAYGAENVHRIVYFVPALWGTASIGDLFAKNLVNEKADSLLTFLLGDSAAGMLKTLSAMMPAGIADAMTEKMIDTLLSEVFVNSGAMWACVPPERYAALAEKYLADADHAELKAQTDRYHAAQEKLPETLKALAANGVNIYICACYGRSLLPALGSAATLSSDGLIDIRSASLGANAAPLGETLPPEACGPDARLSPEGALDASTGAFPDSTWYFYDQYHDSIAYNDTALGVALKALSDESFTSVNSDPALGQFHQKQDNRNA